MQQLTLDLIPQNEKPVLRLSQFDDNWPVRFDFTEAGEAVLLGAADEVTCIIRKPDGNIVTMACNVSPAGYAVCDFNEQSTACYGLSYGEIVIEVNAKRKGTCNFILEVEPSPEFGGIDSTSAIANLQRQINAMVNEAVAEVAPEIIAQIAPSVIGDEYLTKAQIEASYYNKQSVDNKITNAKPRAIIQTLEAGDVEMTFTTSLSASALVEFKINEPDVNEPEIVESTSGDDRIFTLTFAEAFDHDVSVMLLNVLYEVMD